jgi:hypothetical protein
MSFINGEQLASAMIGGLHDAGILSETVWMDPEYNGVAGKGDTVNIRRLAVETATNFDGEADITETSEAVVPVVLSHQPHVQSRITSKEKVLKVEDMYRQIVYPKVQGVAEYLEGAIASTLALTDADPVNAANAKAAIIAARKALSESKVPQADRYLACSPSFISAVLGETWVQAYTLGDGGRALREAIVGRAFGFTVVESTHIADLDEVPTAYAYHRTSAIMASRMPAPPEGGADASTAAQDGYGMRIVSAWDNSRLSDVLTVDTLAGFALTGGQRLVVPVTISTEAVEGGGGSDPDPEPDLD